MPDYAEVAGIRFTDADVANLDDFRPAGEYNPHNIRPWLLHDHYGFTIAVVFASCEQDALDIAVDEGKMDGFMISEEDLADYGEGEGITYLGNASQPFDIESVEIIEMRNPPRSFVAEYNAALPNE